MNGRWMRHDSPRDPITIALYRVLRLRKRSLDAWGFRRWMLANHRTILNRATYPGHWHWEEDRIK